MGIFSAAAPAYWAAGLPVIPLRDRDKRPLPVGWQRFADTMPDAATQSEWLTYYPNGNIGLPLGKQSGLIAIDIDSDDPMITEAVLIAAERESPWCRVGKKGCVLIYRFNNEITFRMRGMVELLSSGTQIVLPPSIHPQTGHPYIANADLLEAIKDGVPSLPNDFEDRLRKALVERGFELPKNERPSLADWVPAGQRDVKMIQMAGLLSHCVIRGERSLFDCINELYAWAATRTEHIAGDDLDATKGVQRLVEFLITDITQRNRRLPAGWDRDLPQEMEPVVAQLRHHSSMTISDLEKEINEKIASTPGGLSDDDLTYIAQKVIEGKYGDVAIDRVAARLKPGGVSKTSLRRRIDILKAESGEEIDNERDAAVEFLNERSKTSPIINIHDRKLMSWNGSAWVELDSMAVKQDVLKMFGKTIKKASAYEGIMRLIETESFKRNFNPQRGVNFANGFLNEDGNLVPHHPDLDQTYTLSFRYLKDAAEPKMWTAFINSVWGHEEDFEERVRCLRFVMCMTFMGIAPRFQKAILLFGKARTGKTTLIETLQKMMPLDATSSVIPSDWAERFRLVAMDGKILNIAGELTHIKNIHADMFNRVVDGTTIQVEQKNQPTFNMVPKAAQWFASNHLPRSSDTSGGFLRRWCILTFNRQIAEADVIPNLQDRLAEEREEIFAWAMKAREEVMTSSTIPLPPSAKAMSAVLGRFNSPLRAFLDSEKAIFDPKISTPKKMLHDAFSNYRISVLGMYVPIGFEQFDQMMHDLEGEYAFKVEKHAYAGVGGRG